VLGVGVGFSLNSLNIAMSVPDLVCECLRAVVVAPRSAVPPLPKDVTFSLRDIAVEGSGPVMRLGRQ
jgi:hypothetical protein